MRRTGRFLCAAALLLAVPAQAQEVAAEISHPHVTPLPQGHIVIDITTATRHPAYLEPLSLKTPDGVRIAASVAASAAAPDNVRTCPRATASGSECRQLFRVTLDTGARCHAAGNYEALFRINCWPGTAASLCKPSAYQFNFKLEAESVCNASPETK